MERPLGRTGRPRTSALERMFDRLDRDLPDRRFTECWEWPGTRIGSGYGTITIGTDKGGSGKQYYVHRIMCAFWHGPAPEDKPNVLHSCDNPPCVNPAHLRWGDQADNAEDSIKRGRSANQYGPYGGAA